MYAIGRFHAILCCLLLAGPISVARPGLHARDTTRNEPRTMFSSQPVAALHFDEAGSTATVNGDAQYHGRVSVRHRILRKGRRTRSR